MEHALLEHALVEHAVMEHAGMERTGTTPAPSPPERLFFALWPTDDVRERIAARAAAVRSHCDPGGRMVGPARYHLTLRYIGQFAPVPAAVVEAAMAAGDAQRVARFELVLDHADAFDRGTWWIGPSHIPTFLQALVDGLDRSLVGRGVAAKADHAAFVAHVTLGRNATAPPAMAIEPLAWPVDGFALMASGGARGGDRMLARWALA
jgi:2'-5' RNA ligase